MPILRFLKARSRALEQSGSSAATSRGSASTTVTSAPNDFHTLANSQPITPPPSTMTDSGTRSSRSAWSEVRMRSPSTSIPGSDLGYEPVARTTLRAEYAVPSTVTSPGPVIRPAPSMTVTPREPTSPVRPLCSRETTPSL